jgi:hypothetical protein
VVMTVIMIVVGVILVCIVNCVSGERVGFPDIQTELLSIELCLFWLTLWQVSS